jgi:hypothetical protein
MTGPGLAKKVKVILKGAESGKESLTVFARQLPHQPNGRELRGLANRKRQRKDTEDKKIYQEMGVPRARQLATSAFR